MKEVLEKIDKFSKERDWDQFHNGKDLAIALSIEASELQEAFLWKNPEDVKKLLQRKVHKRKVGEISSKDIWGVGIDICIDAVQGVLDSQLVEQQFFDNMLMNGALQNTDPEILEAYINASPNVSQRTKTALRTTIAQIKNSKFQQLKNQYSQLLGYTEQIMNYAKQLESVTGYQGNYLKNLTLLNGKEN